MKTGSNQYKFQADENDISLSSRDEVKVINIALTQQASRKIDIMSRHFDAAIYDNADYIEAIKKLSIASKFTRIRILVKDSEPMVKNGHRIIDLVQQLTSSIEVRQIPDEYKSSNEAFSLFDETGLIYLKHADRYEGVANFSRPRLAAELTANFNEIWERSLPDANLRRLHL